MGISIAPPKEYDMDTSNLIDLTLYVVGTDEDDALGNIPFDSEESALSYANDNPDTTIYSVTAYIDPATIEAI